MRVVRWIQWQDTVGIIYAGVFFGSDGYWEISEGDRARELNELFA
jgi:hypothetical protein